MPLPDSLYKLSFGKSVLRQGQVGRKHINPDFASAVVPPFTIATLPSAATYSGQIVSVADGNGGVQCLAWSNGTNWLRIVLGAAVSNP